MQANASRVDAKSSISVNLPALVVAHHALVLAVLVSGDASVVALEDTLGEPFPNVISPITQNDGSKLSLFFASDVPAGSESVTVRLDKPSSSFFVVYIHEYAGISTFDVGNAVVGTTPGAVTTGIVKTTGAKDLVFGFGVSGTMTAGPGFTARSTYDGNLTEDRIVDGPSSVAATGTASGAWGFIVATFK